MNKKKILLGVLAMALVCTLSVAGTLAYLTTRTTQDVTNTFMAAGGGKLVDGTFKVEEHKAVKQADGRYLLKDGVQLGETESVTENTYEVLPGVDLPKDPYITITDKTTAEAYLYVEVKDETGEVLEWEIDDTNWQELTSVTGKNGGQIYVYASNGTATILNGEPEDYTVNILKDKQVTVSNVDGELNMGNASLSFYGYMAQASAGEGAAAAFNACFNADSTTTE